MKFSVNKTEFQKNIVKISSIVPVKPVITVIANILIEAKKNTLTFSSTDFEITMHAEMNANIDQEGAIVVNAKTLVELIKRLPEGTLIFQVLNNELVIECETGEYKIPTLEKDKYVEIVKINKDKLFTIESLPIVNAIENTIFAVAKDAVKISITGILLEASGKGLSFIGTDGHRLAVYSIKDIFEKTQSYSAIVPPKALTIMKGLIADNESFEIGFEENRLIYKIENVEVSVKLIEGTYPDYRRVIPNDNDKVLLVEKSKLLESLNRVNIFTNPNTKLVKFDVENNVLNITAHQSQTGEGIERLNVEFSSDEKFIIGFNNVYLMEIIKKIETQKVKMKLKSEMSAVIIENEESKIGEESLYLIMPLRLK